MKMKSDTKFLLLIGGLAAYVIYAERKAAAARRKLQTEFGQDPTKVLENITKNSPTTGAEVAAVVRLPRCEDLFPVIEGSIGESTLITGSAIRNLQMTGARLLGKCS